MMNDVLYTSIAGINFRATDRDVGQILGYTQPNPVEADPEAIGCFLQDGRMIGFIPKNRQEDYREFEKEGANHERQCLFAGNIKKVNRRDGSSFYSGNIALVKGPNLKELLEAHYQDNFDLYGGQKPS